MTLAFLASTSIGVGLISSALSMDAAPSLAAAPGNRAEPLALAADIMNTAPFARVASLRAKAAPLMARVERVEKVVKVEPVKMAVADISVATSGRSKAEPVAHELVDSKSIKADVVKVELAKAELGTPDGLAKTEITGSLPRATPGPRTPEAQVAMLTPNDTPEPVEAIIPIVPIPEPAPRPMPLPAAPQARAEAEPESIPLPTPRPSALLGTTPNVPRPTPMPRPAIADARVSAPANAGGVNPRTIFDKLFGGSEPPHNVLAYANTNDTTMRSTPRALGGMSQAVDRFTAVYEISSHTVYLPDGTRLEAHSGLGARLDDPRGVSAHMSGATPPNLYDLQLREQLFHGVRALRLTPIGNSPMYGRVGLLAHTYMLGPRGDSNGCVVFKNYKAFVAAYDSGAVKRLAVVDRLN